MKPPEKSPIREQISRDVMSELYQAAHDDVERAARTMERIRALAATHGFTLDELRRAEWEDPLSYPSAEKTQAFPAKDSTRPAA